MQQEPDLTSYRDWLHAQLYQPSTIDSTLRALTLRRSPSKHGPETPHVRRYLRFVAETKQNPMGRDFLAHARLVGHKASSDAPRPGSRKREVLTRGQWTKLLATLRRVAVEDNDDTARMLLAYMHSGRRVTNFLGLVASFAAEREDFVADKLSRNWVAERSQMIRSPGRVLVYQLLCDSERCAYSRMRRRLKAVAGKLGFDVDLDSLRRSRPVRGGAV